MFNIAVAFSFMLAFAGIAALIRLQIEVRKSLGALAERYTEIEANLDRAFDKLDALAAVIDRQHTGLSNHADKLNALVPAHNRVCSDVRELGGAVERLMQIVQSTVDACGAAQRFYDVLTGRGRVPEQELIELGEALENWQRKGRLN